MSEQAERVIPAAFFDRPTLTVARELLGQRLVRVLPDGTRLSGRIIETEGYTPEDPACHAHRGPSERARSMFGPAGMSYVYLIYGMYFCLNAVTEGAGRGAAVLFRALDDLEGAGRMAELRGPATKERDLTRGPARLCKAMAIDRALDGGWLSEPGPLYLAYGAPVADERVLMTPRIGIGATPESQAAPWRFIEAGNAWLSGSRAQNQGRPYDAAAAAAHEV
ncbi:MAG TPA: DNA-3-methyladenine glycosylase [Herpetosiphonaceae bacterium]